ncbi:putative B3 domain-containing protein At5g66980 [Cornus florida]|uniref:putative B3 domain-containing protein At5g66980 n=1 Tax=Cornus florida TaxID=4283 RepID=UPI00289BFE71|nr:putative B3 domain-containing protein At5g66980 [Cornus florida]
MVRRFSRRPKSSSSDNNPEFFKVYFPQKSSQQLCVPPDFVKHFNGTIPTKAILKDLCGKFWHVEMEDVENGVFIKNGWQSFVNHYSIELGDFLVFRYNGNSIFDVRIFGKSGCMKENTLAIEKTATRVKIEEETEAEQTSPKHTNVRKRKYSEVGCKISPESRGLLGPIQLTPQRIVSETIQEKKIFNAGRMTSPKNPYFIATLPSSRLRPASVTIPKSIATNNDIKINPQMVLCDQDRKSWPVNIVPRKDGRLNFSQGFRDFLQDNSIALNDKCLFEFLPDRERSRGREIQVQIIRAGARTRKTP